MTVENFIADRRRVTEFNPVSPTTNFPLDYPLYAADDLTDLKDDLEVFLDGVEVTNYTVTATFDDGVATDAQVVFSPGITGNLKVYSARRPRSTAATVQGRGMTAEELSSAFNGTLASCRDIFDTALLLRGEAYDAGGRSIRGLVDDTARLDSAITRGSLLAYVSLLPEVSLPPYFQTRTAASLSTIGAAILSVLVMAYDGASPVGPSAYVRVNAAPAATDISFRSQDRLLADGVTVDATSGGYWKLDVAPGLDVRAGGVKFDGSYDGVTGTDNRTALQRCINTGAPSLFFSDGIANCNGSLTAMANQRWEGRGARSDDSDQTGVHGSAVNFIQTSTASGIVSAAGEAWEYASHANLSLWAAPTCNARYVVDVLTPRNWRTDNVRIVHSNPGLVDGIYGGGGYRTHKEGGGGSGQNGTAGVSWVHFHRGLHIQCKLDLSLAGGDQTTNFTGHAFAINTDASDVFMTGCYVPQGSCWFKAGAGLHASSSKFDSSGNSGTGRVGVILENGAINLKTAARVATVAAAGNITLSGLQTIDDVVLNDNDRVLVRNQTLPAENGLYAAHAGAWVRTTDADSAAEIMGMSVPITAGTVHAGRTWTILQDVDLVDADIGVVGLTFWNSGALNASADVTANLSGCRFSKHDIALLINCSRNPVQSFANVQTPGTQFNRSFTLDIKLIGSSGITSGGNFSGASFDGPDRQGGPQEPKYIKSNWTGELFNATAREYPNEEFGRRELFVEWDAQWASTSPFSRGADPTIIGTPSSKTHGTTYAGQTKALTILSDVGGGPGAAVAAGVRGPLVCWRGNAAGLGGFFNRTIFSIGTYTAGMSGFVGLLNSTNDLIADQTVVGVNPSTLIQCLAMVFDPGDTNWSIYTAGSGAGAKTSLGAGFPVNDTANGVYEISWWCAPNSQIVKWRAEKCKLAYTDTVSVLCGELGTNLPGAAIRMAPYIFTSTQALLSAVPIDFAYMVTKTKTPYYAGRMT